MAKKETVYVCQECGYESPKWLGKCICGAWNSMIEETVDTSPVDDPRARSSTTGTGKVAKPSVLKRVGNADYERVKTGIGELDRVLGGGLVKGSLVLISGEPGIGKSTLIVQAAANIANNADKDTAVRKVLYISGEESEEQIKMRADRVCPDLGEGLFVMSETSMENISKAVDAVDPEFLIIDSIQTMYTEDLDSAPGSVSQVRTCGNILMKLGKTRELPIFIVAHVTKSGELAGPKIVEHLVDCVLSFTGERDHEIRILRALKNRFGTTSEIGAFEMREEGLKEITDISGSFLENRDENAEGSVITAVYEGSRPIMLEVQALTSTTNMSFARRTSVGIDNQRLSMILAVMEKKLGIRLSDQDVYVNVVGGLRPDSTSVDLGVALAVYSTIRGISSACRTIAIGEVGLTGDLRSVRNAAKIAMEAGKLGYQKILMPERNAAKVKSELKQKKTPGTNIEVIGVRNICDAASEFKGLGAE